VVSLTLAIPGPVGAAFTRDGWIADWLIFGPLLKGGLGQPSEDLLRLDYVSDGSEFFESTILPREGLELRPDFQGASAAEGFHPILGAVEQVAWQHLDTTGLSFRDTVRLFEFYAAEGRGIDGAVVYAVVYVENPGAEPLSAVMELSSDDAILVKLDDCELFQWRVDRSFGEAGTVQDRIAVEIPPGPHRLLVKAFNNLGDFGFRLRFTDAETGRPITDATAPALRLALAPEEIGLVRIDPVGLALRREVKPEVVLGLDGMVEVTLEALLTFAGLDQDAPVTIRERLPAGTFLEPLSAQPPTVAQEGNLLTWRLEVWEALGGIRYNIGFEREVSACIEGEFEVGENPACTLSLTGASCIGARPLDALYLGDIVGGGDGMGTKPGNIVGIDLKTGEFATSFLGRASGPANIEFLTAVNASPWIDSVFFLAGSEINTSGVRFEPDPEDLDGNSWDHILADRTHSMAMPELGVDRIRMAGREDFVTAVGINAAAGVTFDLKALREAHGPDRITRFSTIAGLEDVSGCIQHFDHCRNRTSRCGTITLYIIYTSELEVLSKHTWKRKFESGEAEAYEAMIPEEARFLTLATGRNRASLNCAHGVFAEARILPSPQPLRFRRGDPDDTGVVTLTDAVFILEHLFRSGPAPSCMDAADGDDDGQVSLSDGVFLLNHLFQGGQAPPAPGPSECGPDAQGEGDDLDCGSYVSC
jgi:hypothetical protein